MTIYGIKEEHEQFCIYELMLLLSGLFHVGYNNIYKTLRNHPCCTQSGLAAYQGLTHNTDV